MADREDRLYRRDLRDGNDQNPKFSSKNIPQSGHQRTKEHRESIPSVPDFENELEFRHRNSGGDAGRANNESLRSSRKLALDQLADYESKYLRQMHSESKAKDGTLFRKSYANKMGNGDSSSIFDLGGSSECGKSQNSSSKTVVSVKSSKDLRKMVVSSCRLHDYIEGSIIKKLQKEEEEAKKTATRFTEPSSNEMPRSPLTLPESSDGAGDSAGGGGDGVCARGAIPKNHVPCSRCHGNGTTPIAKKDDDLDLSYTVPSSAKTGDVPMTMDISVDDMVNSKVINPMIKKLQRMYLNNLKEKLSLLEDLESLPNKVSEVYKSNVFKN